MEREIQEVRMGKESLRERPGYALALDTVNCTVIECNVETEMITRELWLGAGALIIWKES